jgi:O-6-methylguanine DNA methyltransferase
MIVETVSWLSAIDLRLVWSLDAADPGLWALLLPGAAMFGAAGGNDRGAVPAGGVGVLAVLGDRRERVRAALENYFALDLPFPGWDACAGRRRLSPFTSQVLTALAAVPRGETVTYGELAARAGNPAAARAVGRAMAANLWPLLLPCHRVVAAGGRLGGYGGGLDLKARLLEQEGVRCRDSSGKWAAA